jgi:hypothetical protein
MKVDAECGGHHASLKNKADIINLQIYKELNICTVSSHFTV